MWNLFGGKSSVKVQKFYVTYQIMMKLKQKLLIMCDKYRYKLFKNCDFSNVSVIVYECGVY